MFLEVQSWSIWMDVDIHLLDYVGTEQMMINFVRGLIQHFPGHVISVTIKEE